jgi:integrase
MAEYVISVYHDTRRKKEGEVYPVKLRVYHNYDTRFYKMGIDLSKEEFKCCYLSERPRSEHKEKRLKILSNLTRAENIAKEIREFDFDKFEKRLLRPSGSAENVFYHYTQKIQQLKGEDRIKTASNYDLSQKSIVKFLESKGKNPEYLSFETITPKFLNDYERWMQKEGKGLTTVSFYIRALRTIFNEAIREGEIQKENYPFRKGLYDIPASSNIKKSLSKADLKKLYEYELPKDSHKYKARQFWFFSYQCNGMNIRDICELKYRNVGNGIITFIRTKTKLTSKSKQRPIIVIITPFIKSVIEEFGSKDNSSDNYVFPILKPTMNAAEKVSAAQAFTKFINQHIKKLAKLVGVDPDISTYYARHSFTTISVQNGASLEFIQDSLGHASISTTMNYWAGFSENVKKENANKLMDFE